MRAYEENLGAFCGFNTEIERMGKIERNCRVLDYEVAQLEESSATDRIVGGVDNKNPTWGCTLLTQGSNASFQ